jgi:methylenetetrahydrofolate dehydrogenase (NAD+)
MRVPRSIRFVDPRTLDLPESDVPINLENPPPGTVKSILPCTPLAIVKTLEHLGVYNRVLKYGDRAYGRIVTVINRSFTRVLATSLAKTMGADLKWLVDR